MKTFSFKFQLFLDLFFISHFIKKRYKFYQKMEFTNELQETDFEEQENENENEESESQTSVSIDHSITIDYYKKLIQTLSKRVNKIKEKLNHNRKIELQFSMLLNKTIENQFGPISDEPSIQKHSVPPLPPIHKESRTEIIRLIHSGTPSEVASFFEKSSVISLLLFSDSSVFDARLKESLMRASPDIQVSFFNSTFHQVKKCGQFIDLLMPLLSQYSTDSLLRSQIFDADSEFGDFFLNFYKKLIKSISELVSVQTIKIVYTTNDFTSFIYPTENFFHIISSTSSACAFLIKKKVNVANFLQKSSSFEIVTEGPLFEDFSDVLSVRFNLSTATNISSTSPAGMVIALSDRKFNGNDESHLSVVVDYISPLLKLVRSLLLHHTPRHFSDIAKSISMLRSDGFDISSYHQKIGEVCGASFCKLMMSKPSNHFKDIAVINEGCEDSIIGKAATSGRSQSCLNPRRNPHFNKEVDDAPQLPKITSMLAQPVKGSDFVFALYNSLRASEFTPAQKSVAESVSRALLPLFEQVRSVRRCACDVEEGDEVRSKFEESLSLVGPMAEYCTEGRLFEYVHDLLSKNNEVRNCLLFVRLISGDVMRFPGGDLVEISDNLMNNDVFYETDKFDLNIDVAGDTKVNRIIVNSSASCTAVITTTGGFDNDNDLDFIRNVTRILIMLAPYVMLDFSLNQCKESQQLLRDSTRFSDSSFSRLINAKVELILFDTPLENDPEIEGAPLLVSIETNRGIEGTLATYDSSMEARAASISYAEWLTSALSKRKLTHSNEGQIYVSLFEEIGLLEVFNISRQELAGWVMRVIHFTDHKSDSGLVFVRDILCRDPWSSFFSEEDRAIVALCSFLRGIEKNWECKSDKETVKLLKKCQTETCASLAAVFASGFGIASNIKSNKRSQLVERMQLFSQKSTMKESGLLVAHVRAMSLRGFKKLNGDVKWLGRAISSLSRIHRFASCDGSEVVKNLVEDFGEEDAKTELFYAERVMLPILSFLSAKDEKLVRISSTVRDSILFARKELH